MNTRNLVIVGAVVTAFAFNSFAAEPLLSPRQKDIQIKVVKSSVAPPTIAIAYVDSTPALLSPRAAGNQIKVLKGVDTTINPALVCLQNMNGTPKAVAECASHANMPGCQATVAPLK